MDEVNVKLVRFYSRNQNNKKTDQLQFSKNKLYSKKVVYMKITDFELKEQGVEKINRCEEFVLVLLRQVGK